MFKTLAKPSQMSELSLLFALTLFYCLAGAVFLHMTGAQPALLIYGVLYALPSFAAFALKFAPWWVYAILPVTLAIFGNVRNMTLKKAVSIVASIVLCSAFTFMFSMVKTQFPAAMPFWADDLFTRLDQLLHFGQNPRDFLQFMGWFGVSSLEKFYLNGWVFIATFFPALLIAFDPDEIRTRQFILLWAACWIVLGNLLALTFMSAGPIFVELVPGVDPDVHADVVGLLAREDAAFLLDLRNNLWDAYANGSKMVGTGISAFPSVHVGMATVFGLYLIRLGHDLRAQDAALHRHVPMHWAGTVAGVLIIAIFLVLSVYLTLHYAVDGYASLIVIWAIYVFLRRNSVYA